MRCNNFEKDGIILFGPFTEQIHKTLEELKSLPIKNFVSICYNAYDFQTAQTKLQLKYNTFYSNTIKDEEVLKIGSTFSRPLKRLYSEENSDIFIKTLLKKGIVAGFSMFATTTANYRSKFYVLKDIQEQKYWIKISDNSNIQIAKKTIQKINDRKNNKNKESLNLNGFNFQGILQALQCHKDKQYDYLLDLIKEHGIEALFQQKVVRSNGSFYNLIGNLKKEIRLNLSHESQDVMELDLEAAFPSILPNFLDDFLFSFQQQYSSNFQKLNLSQPEKFKMDREKLKEELERFKEKDIYTTINDYLVKYNVNLDRKDLKLSFLIFLFANPKEQSKKPKPATYVKLAMKRLFPEIYKALLIVKNYIGYNKLAICIQTMMSDIMKQTMKLIRKTNKECPLIPIYDCFITTKENQQLVYHSFQNILEKNKLSHIKIKTKNLKEYKDPTDLVSSSLNQVWTNNQEQNNDNQNKTYYTYLDDKKSYQARYTFKGRLNKVFEATLEHYLRENREKFNLVC